MSRRFAKLMLQIKTVHFYTVLESSTYLLNTSLTRMNVFFFTLGDLMKEVKNFFLHRHLLGVTHLAIQIPRIHLCHHDYKNCYVFRKGKKKKIPKNITTLVCFALSSWDVWNWQKGKTGERMVTGKKFHVCWRRHFSNHSIFYQHAKLKLWRLSECMKRFQT